VQTDDLNERKSPEKEKPGEFILLSLSAYSVIWETDIIIVNINFILFIIVVIIWHTWRLFLAASDCIWCHLLCYYYTLLAYSYLSWCQRSSL